ncbi:hypothetical protein [Microbacterium album]|uniref:hypothetical protein n=1 Tax=Microbacterium album TaxID=2053191 RepID=UPI00166B3A91|nr:hypothetical protein [Microbacterium album]
MLAFLAAIVPILGSLYSGASFLLEHAALRRERRIREHVQKLAYARLTDAEARSAVRSRLEPGVFHSPYDEVHELQVTLLKAHGLERAPSLSEADIALAMSGAPASQAERRRQTVLLVTATIGVVLLAFDAM